MESTLARCTGLSWKSQHLLPWLEANHNMSQNVWKSLRIHLNKQKDAWKVMSNFRLPLTPPFVASAWEGCLRLPPFLLSLQLLPSPPPSLASPSHILPSPCLPSQTPLTINAAMFLAGLIILTISIYLSEAVPPSMGQTIWLCPTLTVDKESLVLQSNLMLRRRNFVLVYRPLHLARTHFTILNKLY